MSPAPGSTDESIIRNFCIIAHIDHGKSTLADRMLQITGVVDGRDMRAQYLDRMDIERERGITIKSQAVRLPYVASDGIDYVLNLIDTPGHVDFTYEVSRSLAACEGAILLVDAAQGIEAQTLANLYLALENDLAIIPVLNKIDLPAAQPERYAAELAHIIGCDPADVLQVSAKTGKGVRELLDEVVRQVPAPAGDPDAPARALIFDSVYDSYRGVITYVRVIDGKLSTRERIVMMSTGVQHEMLEVGVISPDPVPSAAIGAGEVGYLITGVKDVRQSRVGDTVTAASKAGATTPLGGYRDPKPMVFSGLYPIDGSDYPELRDALDKLKLNDAALVYEPETSGGARVRLPLRLPRAAAPGDRARAPRAGVQPRPDLDGPERDLPGDPGRRPQHRGHQPLGVPEREGRRGPRADRARHDPEPHRLRGRHHGALPEPPRQPAGHGLPVRHPRRAALHAAPGRDRLRLLRRAEVAHPRLRLAGLRDHRRAGSRSRQGRHPAARRARRRLLGDRAPRQVLRLWGCHGRQAQGADPRQQFEVPIQAAIGSRIIARESVRAMRKDVLAKCYGGDITRKRKLLEKQKEGKKRMKMVGRVEIPQEAFIAALNTEGEQGAKK